MLRVLCHLTPNIITHMWMFLEYDFGNFLSLLLKKIIKMTTETLVTFWSGNSEHIWAWNLNLELQTNHYFIFNFEKQYEMAERPAFGINIPISSLPWSQTLLLSRSNPCWLKRDRRSKSANSRTFLEIFSIFKHKKCSACVCALTIHMSRRHPAKGVNRPACKKKEHLMISRVFSRTLVRL